MSRGRISGGGESEADRIRTQLAAAQAENERLRKRVAELNRQVNPVCCCGSSYNDHGYSDNHSFVDAYAYAEMQRLYDERKRVVEEIAEWAGHYNQSWSNAILRKYGIEKP
jgi:hypothetical protein